MCQGGRVKAKDEKPFTLKDATREKLVEALKHPNMTWRLHAQRLLIDRGKPDVVPALTKLIEDKTLEEVEKGVFIPFIHRPLSRYVNGLVRAGLAVTGMDEPAPPPGFLARAEEYADAATIPRLLFIRAEKIL